MSSQAGQDIDQSQWSLTIAAYQGIIPGVMEGWSGGLVTMQITTSIMQV
jgi:hypothetical protein